MQGDGMGGARPRRAGPLLLLALVVLGCGEGPSHTGTRRDLLALADHDEALCARVIECAPDEVIEQYLLAGATVEDCVAEYGCDEDCRDQIWENYGYVNSHLARGCAELYPRLDCSYFDEYWTRPVFERPEVCLDANEVTYP